MTAAFIGRWSASGASERANGDLFLAELCDVLGLPRPEPASGDDERAEEEQRGLIRWLRPEYQTKVVKVKGAQVERPVSPALRTFVDRNTGVAGVHFSLGGRGGPPAALSPPYLSFASYFILASELMNLLSPSPRIARSFMRSTLGWPALRYV